MRIRVFAATGQGPTALAAFDRALRVGGVQDTNLVALSSIVPAGATVTRGVAGASGFCVGDRLYCVMARSLVSEPGAEAWAGLGWALDRDGRGGLFVEAHGRSGNQVQYELGTTMDALVADRGYWDVGDPDVEVAGIVCEREPVCALVMAIYQSVPWDS